VIPHTKYAERRLNDCNVYLRVGNFAYAAALARHLGPAAHVLPTGYDSAAAALALPGAHESLAALKELGVAVLHSVDATALGPEVGRGRATVPPAFALADRGRRRCAPGRAP
jgi:hypothetical protein